MRSISREARMERFNKEYSQDKVLSVRTYNLILGGVVLYGLVVNYILCAFAGEFAQNINPIILYIGYFVLGMLGIFIANKSNSAIISFVGYNMLCVPLGLIVAVSVQFYGGIDSRVVRMVFFYTIIITAIMVLSAIAFPQLFEKIGKALFIALIGIAICGIFVIFFQGLHYVYSLFAAVLFSLYIGFDFYRSQKFVKTADNAVDCALDIYLDIVNLFLTLLSIFGKSRD